MKTSPTFHRRGDYCISLDPSHLDLDAITLFLQHDSYWAQRRTRLQMEQAIGGSRWCFGLFQGDPCVRGAKQVGFARVVSDGVTFAWLCDVFVLAEHRGGGLAKWLIEVVTAHAEIAAVSMFVLATRDAHGLYERYGDFEALPQPERWMRRRRART